MTVANLLENIEELPRGSDEAAFTENRFHNHRGNSLGRHDSFECIFQMVRAKYAASRILERIRAAVAIGVGDAVDIGRERLKTCFVRMRLACERHREHRPSMERILEADNRRAARVATRDFHGVLDGLRSAIDEHRLLRKIPRDDGIQLLRQLDIFPIRRDTEAGVQERLHLFANGG